MRLEVLVGFDDPLIFPLDKSRIILGSGEGCDIIIDADGVSRRHVLITTEDDLYYITDQGSTNGSFVNEEKLQPGKRVELTSFFPVRLGTNTLLSLLSDEEAMKASNPRIVTKLEKDTQYEESTRVINVKDLRRAKTDDLIKKRDEARSTKKKVVKKKKKDSYWPMALGGLILVGSFYLNYVNNQKEETVVPPTSLVTDSIVIEDKVPVESALIDEDLLPTKPYMQDLLKREKCMIDTELYFCNLLKTGPSPFGALTIGLTNYVFIDATIYYQQAMKELTQKYSTPEAIRDLAAYIFILKKVEKLDLALLKESRVVIGLFKKNEQGEFMIENIIAFKPKFFNENRDSINPAALNVRTMNLHSYIGFTKNFYHVY